jgi:hypothetical protein
VAYKGCSHVMVEFKKEKSLRVENYDGYNNLQEPFKKVQSGAELVGQT